MLISEFADALYSPVLALTIIDDCSVSRPFEFNAASKILLGVRDPENNDTHPNVVSVPTKRIPFDVFAGIDVKITHEVKKEFSKTYLLSESNPDPRENGHSHLNFAVKSILAEKLGLADQMETKTVSFKARLGGVVFGTVKHEEFKEKTCMYNALVMLSGCSHVPPRTASYRSLLWTPVQNFIHAAAEKDLNAISEELNPFEFCIHGLCVMSSFNVLTAVIGGEFYPFEPTEL